MPERPADCSRRAFWFPDSDALPTTPVSALYTYRDMEDIARHGADWRSTRLGQWLLACLAAGRPPVVRGAAHHHRSRDRGLLPWLSGDVREHARRTAIATRAPTTCASASAPAAISCWCGAGRTAWPRRIFSGLKQVSGLVTRLDRRFAEAARAKAPESRVPEAILRGIQDAAAA